ncbi:MAG TPA: DUF512 domain-containing protein [Desulfuromonadales bacterium]|nr:DUF512 domain-containing protein [Desulfuromonadales bacterium]
MKGLLVESIAPGSIAEEMGVEAGDRLILVNGNLLRDVIDYSYHIASDCELHVEVLKPDGELWELEIDRELNEPLGLLFHPPDPIPCSNNCQFCFVHQLPPGLRKQLYVKDEDYRLSFLNGNYVTLANLSRDELARIKEQRLSPLYISVHTTNHDLRQHMLGKRGIPNVLEQMKILSDTRIAMHTQIVLCPGLNDGTELERTISELSELYPAVLSLAIVPLGMTRHRESLPKLQPVTADYAREFLSTWTPTARALRQKLGRPFLMFADEFYLKAGQSFPALGEYGDLPQIENGVGMVPLFIKQARKTVQRAKPLGTFIVTVATGTSTAGFVDDFLENLSAKTGVTFRLIAVGNKLFGESVTVTGLVAGNDIIDSLTGKHIGEALMIPDVMLKEGTGLFLDDVTLKNLAERLGRKIATFEPTPDSFYQAVKALTLNI